MFNAFSPLCLPCNALLQSYCDVFQPSVGCAKLPLPELADKLTSFHCAGTKIPRRDVPQAPPASDCPAKLTTPPKLQRPIQSQTATPSLARHPRIASILHATTSVPSNYNAPTEGGRPWYYHPLGDRQKTSVRDYYRLNRFPSQQKKKKEKKASPSQLTRRRALPKTK